MQQTQTFSILGFKRHDEFDLRDFHLLMFHAEYHWVAQVFTDCILNIQLQVYEPFKLQAKRSHLWIPVTSDVQMFGFIVYSESWNCLLGHWYNWGLPLRKLKMQSDC